ncbi:MAG: glycosyltransferase family 25 protein [Pseudomonadota bacterium]
MSIPCWVISLDPSSAMASGLARELTAAGVDFRFVPAVDGRKGTPPLEGREHFDHRKALIRHGRILRDPELGCYLSHYRALQRAWDEGLERVCILEDDVGLEENFPRVLAGLAGQPAEVEMVRLMALRVRRRKVLTAVPDCPGHRLVRPERGWCGTQGYVINRAGMRKVLDAACRIYEPIDKFYDHFWEYGLRHYGVEPHVIYEHEHVSSIQKKKVVRPPVPLFYRLLAPLEKFSFSRSRHRYLKANAAEFYPAAWPEERMGRTRRMH